MLQKVKVQARMRGKIARREWMLGNALMRGLPRSMRAGWQVCIYLYSLNTVHIIGKLQIQGRLATFLVEGQLSLKHNNSS